MPGVNNVALSAGIIAVTVVVAAGIAIYESPELRRMAEELRRRISVALHSLGDSISPQERENLFNRPEDAEGFLRSRGIDVRENLDVDADDETRRRQREELMYWNAIAESKKAEEARDAEKTRPRAGTRGSSFDDFLKQDESGEKGSYVFNSSADVRGIESSGLRHRGDGIRGLSYSVHTNPFADEHGIDEHVVFENSLMGPEKDELEDIYSVSDGGRRQPVTPIAAVLTAAPEPLVDLTESEITTDEHMPAGEHHTTPINASISQSVALSDASPSQDEFMTAGQEDRHVERDQQQNDAYSSIQAWAQTSNPSFYSPLPVSPAAPLSEAELVSDGVLTPTDTMSLAGSGVDIAEDVRSNRSEAGKPYYDVLSDDEGMETPASWTEVGSVVSEADAAPPAPQPVHP
jgi:hypothetical protein